MFRLRKCSAETTFRPELVSQPSSIIRELHVYGSVVPVSGRDVDKFQHQGYGALLMEIAEKIAIKEHNSEKLAVISGVGTRDYYRKLGYHLEGPYMVKSLRPSEYKNVFIRPPEELTARLPGMNIKVDFVGDKEFLDNIYKSWGYKEYVSFTYYVFE